MTDRAASGTGPHAASQRIDLFLWYARLAPSRSAAQALAARAIIRLNGRRIERAHTPVRAGDVIVMPQGQAVRAIRILSLPIRRGPATEALGHYEALESDAGHKDIYVDAGAPRA